MGVLGRLRALDDTVLRKIDPPSTPRVSPSPPESATAEALRELDNRVLGRPLTAAEAEARLRKRRVRPSWTLASLAAVAPVVLVLKAADVLKVAWWRPALGLVVTYLCGVAAWRLHRRGL
jgi:hypothetical protein